MVTAVAWVRSLAWERLHAVSAAKKVLIIKNNSESKIKKKQGSPHPKTNKDKHRGSHTFKQAAFPNMLLTCFPKFTPTGLMKLGVRSKGQLKKTPRRALGPGASHFIPQPEPCANCALCPGSLIMIFAKLPITIILLPP